MPERPIIILVLMMSGIKYDNYEAISDSRVHFIYIYIFFSSGET